MHTMHNRKLSYMRNVSSLTVFELKLKLFNSHDKNFDKKQSFSNEQGQANPTNGPQEGFELDCVVFPK